MGGSPRLAPGVGGPVLWQGHKDQKNLRGKNPCGRKMVERRGTPSMLFHQINAYRRNFQVPPPGGKKKVLRRHKNKAKKRDLVYGNIWGKIFFFWGFLTGGGGGNL